MYYEMFSHFVSPELPGSLSLAPDGHAVPESLGEGIVVDLELGDPIVLVGSHRQELCLREPAAMFSYMEGFSVKFELKSKVFIFFNLTFYLKFILLIFFIFFSLNLV